MYPTERQEEGPVEVLRRWEASGATWRVLARTPERLTVGLFSCDGGEQVGRVSADGGDDLAALVAFLAGRGSSEEQVGRP